MPVAIDFETHEELKRQLAQAEADGERMMAEIGRLRAEIAILKVTRPGPPLTTTEGQ